MVRWSEVRCGGVEVELEMMTRGSLMVGKRLYWVGGRWSSMEGGGVGGSVVSGCGVFEGSAENCLAPAVASARSCSPSAWFRAGVFGILTGRRLKSKSVIAGSRTGVSIRGAFATGGAGLGDVEWSFM